MIYIFDVDGTLTPSRGTIDPEFKIWFIKFCKRNRVCLVTGSDYAKTLEQVSKDVLDVVEFSFNCSGNAIYVDHNLVQESEWHCPEDLRMFLKEQIDQSPYHKKFGNHIEERIGMVNFSIVGRNAQGSDRTDYYEWDKISGERIRISQIINKQWPAVQAVVGGETGIDIFERGADKSQILNYIKSDELTFFGDRVDPDGNDFSLAKAIIDKGRGRCYNVNTWTDTWSILKSLWPNV